MKNKILLSLLILVTSTTALASGYTFLNGVSHNLHVAEHFLTLSLVAVILMAVGLIYNLKVKDVNSAIIPDSGLTFRNIFEAYGEFIYNLAKNIMGEEEARKYFKIIASIFLLVFVSNFIGLIPGFLPPTDNLNTTIAFGFFVFLYYNYQGVKAQGVVGHIKHFMGPFLPLAPLIFIIEVISHVVRPLSLGLRLRGNMFGDHLVLSIFSGILPYLIPIVFYVIGLFVCFMQAFVFTLLTMVYIGLATAHHDHGDEAENHH